MSEEFLFVQIYTDEHIQPALAEALRRAGYVALNAQEANTLGWTDAAHLAYAAERGMAIMTCDQNDFRRLAREWQRIGREHAGIILSQQFAPRNFKVLLHQTLNLLNSITADEIRNTVVILKNFSK